MQLICVKINMAELVCKALGLTLLCLRAALLTLRKAHACGIWRFFHASL